MDTQNGVDIYYCYNGLQIKEDAYVLSGRPIFDDYYSAWDSTALVGVNYDTGTWS